MRQFIGRTTVSAPVAVLLVLWALIMIALPIVKAVAATDTFNAVVTLSVVVQAAAVLIILGDGWGARRTLLTGLAVGVLAWSIEAIGSASGIPFGAYHYTDVLRPNLLGVPLLIPLAWLMMLPVAWAVAQILVGRIRRWAFIIVSAAAFTAWDLFLDPQMVAWGYWAWEQPGGYFGIPWVNFGGWLLAAAFLTWVVNPLPVPTLPLLFVYTITWALESIGLIAFFRMSGPGLVGFVVMGLFVILSWRRVFGRAGEAAPVSEQDQYA